MLNSDPFLRKQMQMLIVCSDDKCYKQGVLERIVESCIDVVVEIKL